MPYKLKKNVRGVQFLGWASEGVTNFTLGVNIVFTGQICGINHNPCSQSI